ncbi:MAG: hypothetical protein AB7G11_06760, partial [Phycisphaerales bacterium]
MSPRHDRSLGFDGCGAALERLEPRLVLAGVTMITHGQESAGAMSPWVEALADEIDARTPGQDARIRLTVSENQSGQIVSSATLRNGLTPASSVSGETIVTLDWSSLSTGLPIPTNDTVEVGYAVALALLSPNTVPGSAHALAELPLHLIGHGRGGSLVSEIARVLGRVGVWVDQLTTLDPYQHPSGADAPAGVTQTVLFADNYFQTQDIVTGQSLGSMASESPLSSLAGGYDSMHSDVHLWYHATVDVTGPFSDGAAGGSDSLRDSWFGMGQSRGASAGFSRSRIAGGTRTLAGLHPALGGTAAREPLSSLAAYWPNVLGFSIAGNPDRISRGSPLNVGFTYADTDSSSRVVFSLDSDANPYNANDAATLGEITVAAATDGWFSGSLTLGTGDALIGEYFVRATIFDAMFPGVQRFLYLHSPIQLVGRATLAPDSILAGSASAANVTNVSARNIDGRPVLLQSRGAGWSAFDLTASTGGPSVAESESVVTWIDPKDGLSYAAAISAGGVIVYTQTADSGWHARDLTSELAGAGASRVVSGLTALVGRDNLVRLAGLGENGDLLLYSQTGARVGADFSWTFRNLVSSDLAPQGQAMPAFVGNLTSYVTDWNGLNIAGLDASGRIQVVWWAPGLERWQATDLTAATGAPRLGGDLTVYLTGWGGINLAGLDDAGRVTVTWWVPGFGGEWRTNNLTGETGGPALRTSSVTSYVTPWGGLNIAGIDPQGRVLIYWWVPGFLSWVVTPVSDDIPGAIPPQRRLTGVASPVGTINLFGVGSDGDVLRFFWNPGQAWRQQNVTELAL